MKAIRRILSAVGDFLNRLVADRKSTASRSSNYIPNSNGEGGRIVTGDHSSGRH